MLITSLNPTYLWCFSPDPYCYKVMQVFMVTGLFAGQHNTEIYTIVGSAFAGGLGEVSAHSFSYGIIRFWRELMPLFFVQLSLHQVETRQIQYYYAPNPEQPVDEVQVVAWSPPKGHNLLPNGTDPIKYNFLSCLSWNVTNHHSSQKYQNTRLYKSSSKHRLREWNALVFCWTVPYHLSSHTSLEWDTSYFVWRRR